MAQFSNGLIHACENAIENVNPLELMDSFNIQ